MAQHSFLARTVMVGDRGLNWAVRALQRIMTTEKHMKDINLKRYYEKPTIKRRRIKYENSLRLYNTQMKEKVEFLMKQQRRETPWS